MAFSMPVRKTRETKAVLIAYEKEINKRSHARKPSKVITGNVIIFVYKDFADYFNVPVYTGDVFIINTVSEYQRERENKLHFVDSYQRPKRHQRKRVRKVEVITNDRSFALNFPHFFNNSMVRDSLYLIMRKNIETAKFKVGKCQKIRSIFIGNKDMVQVFLPKGNEMITPRNLDANLYGTPTIVDAPIRRDRNVSSLAK